ncbi:TonB-dependent receptor [Sphingomonas sp. ID0503]|uniref:TonB-dependent receptor n=1 Tax=Sphingomonas sp. ID0503 TaxID=3399691 RepID=UPI003AFB1818
MKSPVFLRLLGSSALLLVSVSSATAFAQTAPSGGDTGGAGPAGAAPGQPGAAGGAGPGADASSSDNVGEIVVTATKREQSLNRVGLTISALSGQQLATQRVGNVADLAKVTPGLTFAPTPNSTPVYTIRGVGFFEASLAAYPSVSLYLDQVPLSLPAMSALTAFDLERVEVLKGPQGTLFGNNATAGAINFVAAKPTDAFHAGAELSYGRFNMVEGSAYVSGALTSTMKARLAVKFARGDDWQKSYTRVDGGVDPALVAIGVAPSSNNRQDTLGETKNVAGRFLLDWEPSDSLRFSFNLNGWRDQSDPQAPQHKYVQPQNPPGSVGPIGAVPANLPIFLYPIAPNKARAADWDPNHRPFADNKFWQTSLRADYDLSDDLTITSISGYSHLRFLNATESDGTSTEGLDLDPDIGKVKSFTSELRIANSGSNRLRYTLGANYEHTTADELIYLYIGGTSSRAQNGFSGNAYGSDQTMKNYAAFGNIEFDVTDQITLKGGIRQTKAKRDAFIRSPFETPGLFPGGALGPCSLTNFFNATYAALYGGAVPTIQCGEGIAIDNRVNADGTPVDPDTYLTTKPRQDKLNEDSTSWSAGVDFKPTSNLLIYLNVSRGFKAGSFPTLAGAIYSAYDPVTQEKLTDYEGGFKAQLFDRKVSINGAAFLYDFRDKQLRAKFVDPIFGALDNLVNVPKSKVKGAEISINAQAAQGLTLSASATYLDAKVRRYDGIVGSTVNSLGLRDPVIASFKGVDLPFAPELQYAIRADYTTPINDRFNFFIGAGVNGQSSSIGILTTSALDRERYKINARALVDGNLGIATADGHWRMTVWGKNIFNKYYWTQAIQAYDNIVRYAGRPAEYGVSASYKF